MRNKIFSSVMTIFFILIFCGVFYLQLLRWPLYQSLSRKNHIKLIPLEGLRGAIYDRNGQTLVDNRLSFDVVIIPQEMENPDKTYAALSKILGMPKTKIEAIVTSDYQAPFAPITIARNVDKDIAFLLEETKQEMPGVMVQSRALRWYLYGEEASHVIGYLGLINKDELEYLRGYGYSISDYVGRAGAEKTYDRYLKGEDGGMQLEVDAAGRLIRVLSNKNQKKGQDITLSIDAKLQKYASECLSDHKGAIIIMDTDNGEVLAMASSPTFDSDVFIDPNKNTIAVNLTRSGSRPLLNRAISGQYPPGSIFKIIVSMAGLETGKIDENTTFTCTGTYRLGNTEFNCWKEGGHGPQNLRQAIIHSCNIYFYNVGRKLGPDILAEYAGRFGLGKTTGVDLAGEVTGLVPTPKWKRGNRRENWFEGETVNYAIGQGQLLVTPLQMLEAVSVFATEGNVPRAHLIKKIGDLEIAPPKARNTAFSKDSMRIIRSAMRQVVDSDEGTGQRARVEGLSFAAKTGTAQTPSGEPHAWFFGYAPADKPKISFVVLIEHGGMGGGIAADITKRLLEFIRDNTEILKSG